MKHILIYFLSFLTVGVFGQQFNQFNAQGKKHGIWTKNHTSSGTTRYTGKFNNGIPVDTFVYFYETEKLQAISVFSNNGKKTYTVNYYPKGGKLAEGIFLNTKRDSIWRFYDNRGLLLSETTYFKGLPNGISKVYYTETGKVSEEVTYRDSVKHGPFKQFFTDGTLKTSGTYVDGNYDGIMRFYFLNGKVQSEGRYVNSVRHGAWITYEKGGNILKIDFFNYGKLLLGEDKDKAQKEFDEKYKVNE